MRASFSAPADVAGQPGSVYGLSAASGAAASQTGAQSQAGAAAATLANEQFAALERKLRDLGASYYLLETWGNDGELYRFQCKMGVGGNPNYQRHFEATDRDKLQAMARVLEQVEAWRNGRLP